MTKSYGSKALFKDLSLSIFEKDRLGLIGPNGSGKSTLLKILTGIEKGDCGTISYKKDLKIGYVPQTCEFADQSPEEILVDSLNHETSLPDYEKIRMAQTWLTKLEFKQSSSSAATLSGGWKKRLALAAALITAPDLLLLDEPTNHLDLEGILWLERFLLKEAPTFLLVTHDRYFLQNVTNRIIELDHAYPKGCFSLQGSYLFFLEKKEEFLEGQLQQEKGLASKARRELAWLRQSPKARTTKATSRIEHAEDVLEQLAQVHKRNQKKTASISFDASERETRKLLVATNLSKRLGERSLFTNLTFTLTPGMRMGLMGPNGAGKTTLLRLLEGGILPDQGTLKKAEDLRIVYFDQHRTLLPEGLSLREALSPTGDYVLFRGERIHVNGWCKRFLFSPDLLDMPLKYLSGGERARISIAHLMLKPADLLLLDEPTNDLDVPTLEMLESSLIEFPGAVVLITHDRCMLDRLCTTLLALGNQPPAFYADYLQWEAAQIKPPVISEKKSSKRSVPQTPQLTSQEKQEYRSIEGKILKLEEEIQKLNKLIEQEEILNHPVQLQEVCNAIAIAENQIEQLYIRWHTLEEKIGSFHNPTQEV